MKKRHSPHSWCKNRFRTWSLWDPNITFEMKLTCHEFCNSRCVVRSFSQKNKFVSKKSHKIWKWHCHFQTVSRWLGSYIYYYHPIALLKEISRSLGGLRVMLACKKIEEREVKGSQFVTQCHVKITPLIYFHLLSLGTMLLCLRLCRCGVFCSSIIWM